MTSILQRFLNRDTDEADEQVEPKKTAPWDSYRYKPVKARSIRRRKIADVLANQRKNEKHRRRKARTIEYITEKEAVRRVREWERKHPLYSTALDYLIAEGVYTLDDILEGGVPIFDIADKLGLLEEETRA